MGAEAGVEADVEVLGGKDESSRLGCWLMGGGIEYVGWSCIYSLALFLAIRNEVEETYSRP